MSHMATTKSITLRYGKTHKLGFMSTVLQSQLLNFADLYYGTVLCLL